MAASVARCRFGAAREGPARQDDRDAEQQHPQRYVHGEVSGVTEAGLDLDDHQQHGGDRNWPYGAPEWPPQHDRGNEQHGGQEQHAVCVELVPGEHVDITGDEQARKDRL